MENFLQFENNTLFKIFSLSLAIVNTLFFFSHIYLINNLNKDKEKIKEGKFKYSCLCIIFQLISSSLFFGILNKLSIKNTTFLSISYLIGVVLSLEWYFVYMYYYNKERILFALLFFLIPLLIVISIFLLFFLINDFNKLFETIIKNISFAFYLFMFVSPGLNIVKLIKTRNPKYIMIPNSIIGIISNIGMISFIFSLNYFNIIDIYFITYPAISMFICIFEVIFYCSKINNKSYDLYDDENDDINPGYTDYSNDNDSRHKKISLITRNSVEEE